MEAESKCRNKSRKVISHFYIPPPARKTENVSPLVLNGQKSKERPVEKLKNENENMKICNNSSLLFKLEKTENRHVQNAPLIIKKKRRRKKNRNGKSKSDFENLQNESSLMNEEIVNSVEEISVITDLTINEDNLMLRSNVNEKVVPSISEKLFKEEVTECSQKKDSCNPKISIDSNDYSADDNPGLICNPSSNQYNNIDIEGDVVKVERVKNHYEKTEKKLQVAEPHKQRPLSDPINEERSVQKSNEQIPLARLSISDEGNSVLIDDWEKLLEDDLENIVAKSKANENTTSTKKSNHISEEKENDSSVIEIYGFPEEFKTQDLYAAFSPYVNRGFQLKWVDNTHALGILPSPSIADEVLSCGLPFVKTRPLSQATPLSKEKAKNLILPSSSRPKTCSALARRLVSGALGVRAVFTPAEIKAEKEILKEAREQRKLAAKQRDAAWEGKF